MNSKPSSTRVDLRETGSATAPANQVKPRSFFTELKRRNSRFQTLLKPSIAAEKVVTVLLHTTALRGNRWELNIPKPFLKPGAFHLQQVQTVSTIKLERRLGSLTSDEMKLVLTALSDRLGFGDLKQR